MKRAASDLRDPGFSESNIPEPHVPDLAGELRRLLRQIPRGRVTTYGELGQALGDVKAARWVGEYLVDHPHNDRCPCHRVVLRNGRVGLFITRNSAEKIARLAADGVPVVGDRVPLAQRKFNRFRSAAPLSNLRQIQEMLSSLNRFPPLTKLPEWIAGVDVSYGRDGQATGCYALFRRSTGERVWSHIVRQPAPFPYIPGYLTFREVPVHLELLRHAREAGREAEVLIVDGNGILHHRLAGVATYLGLVTQSRTIGVGKSLLCGSVLLEGLVTGETRPVRFQDQVVGAAIRSGPRAKPIFVSPGAGIDLAGAVQTVQACFAGHRIPEPIYWADRLSRAAAREVGGALSS